MVSLGQCSQAQHNTGMDPSAAIERWSLGDQSGASPNAEGPWMPSAGSMASRLTVLPSHSVQMQQKAACPFVNKWGQQV